MNKNEIKIGTKVVVHVRDKLGSFNTLSSTAVAEVVFISPVADYVVVNMGNHCTCYWCNELSPV